MIRSVALVRDEGIAHPVLLGRPAVIQETFRELELDPTGIEIIDPTHDARSDAYVDELFRLRQRKGLTRDGARVTLRGVIPYAAMMVRMGDADGMIAGISQRLPEAIRPMVQILGLKPGIRRLSGVQVLYARDRLYFFAENGDVRVVKAGPKFELLAENPMDDYVMATPAISNAVCLNPVSLDSHMHQLP